MISIDIIKYVRLLGPLFDLTSKLIFVSNCIRISNGHKGLHPLMTLGSFMKIVKI